MKLRISSAALALLGLLTFTGCKDFFNVNVDPIHPTSATPEQLLPGTQVALGTYLGFSLSGLGQATSTLVGQLNSGRGVGSFQQGGSSFSNQWSGLYQDMLVNNELIIKQCTAPSQAKFLGVAQLQKAYTFSVMVDMWGEIPYSQALNGTGDKPSDKAPRFDDDRDIYFGNPTLGIEGLFALIDKGIANVRGSDGTPVTGDVIYQGDMLKWEKFGNTLKLKLYNQIRKLGPAEIPFDLNAAVTTALTKPMLQTGEDFELPYGSSFQPENRNISFLSNYVSPSREDFINRDFFKAMIDNRDPRVPFYFYNQAATGGSATDDNFVYALPAANSPTGGLLTFNFATVRLGSTGPLAAAAAANLITLPGLYPSGGRFDLGGGTTVLGGADFSFGRGVVAQRLLTVASRYFTEAELRLTLLNQPAATAKAAYTQGVREAFLKVDAIGKADGATTTVKAVNGQVPAIDPSTRSATAYINAANSRYDNTPAPGSRPTTDREKLGVIIYEKYVAGFGTGIDLYTDYRRTDFPVFRLPGEVPGTVANGGYPRRLFYDIQEITSNRNAPRRQAGPAELIFWDKQ